LREKTKHISIALGLKRGILHLRNYLKTGKIESFFRYAKPLAPRREAFSDAQNLQHHVGKLFPLRKTFSTTSGSFFHCAKASAPRREAFPKKINASKKRIAF